MKILVTILFIALPILVACTSPTDTPDPTVTPVPTATPTPMPTATPAPAPHYAAVGTGILLQHDGEEYVVTALHVAEQCNFSPLIDLHGRWTESTWRIIGTDEENDLAVLQRVGENDQRIGRLNARYGKSGTIAGSTVLALGFPGSTTPIVFSRYGGKWRPIPIGVLALSYPSLEDKHFIGGYVNHGFSGGPIVAWSGNYATITGIITQKALTTTPSGENEHAGLIGVTDIVVAERILAKHKGQTMDEFQNGKPMTSTGEQQYRNPSSLMRGEIMDAVIRLGTFTE